MSGSTPSCSQANIFPVRPTPRLHLVRHQQDAVAVAELAEGRQIAGGRNDVAAFALDRLDEDRRHILGIEMPGEELLLDDVDAPAVAGGLVGAELAAVAVGEGDVVHIRQQRPEAGVLAGLARGQRHRAGGAAVERAPEGDDRGAPGGVAGELDGRLRPPRCRSW